MRRFNEETARCDEAIYSYMAIKIRVKWLIEKYPNVINYTSIMFDPSIDLNDDMEIPDDFQEYCEEVGLKIKAVSKKMSHRLKSEFYYRINFHVIENDAAK